MANHPVHYGVTALLLKAPLSSISPARTTPQQPPSRQSNAVSLNGQLTSADVDAGDTASHSLKSAVIKDSTGNTINDDDGNPITVQGLEIKADGSWSFDPSVDAYNDLAKGQEQTITVDYTVTDGSGETGSSSFTINDQRCASRHLI